LLWAAGKYSSWTFDRLNVTNNIAKGAGAGLMGEYSIGPHLDSLIITGNNADTFGGALNANFAFMVYTNTYVSNNYAGLFCGGLFAIFSELFVFTSTVTTNRRGPPAGLHMRSAAGLRHVMQPPVRCALFGVQRLRASRVCVPRGRL